MIKSTFKIIIVILGTLLSAILITLLAHVFIAESVNCSTSIKRIEAKLDSIQCNKCRIDTVYIDVDDMSQCDWRLYTPEYSTKK